MLFATFNHVGIDSCIQAIPTYITKEHNKSLNAEFTRQGVKEGLFMMNPLRAPGHDGFPNWSYKRDCHSIGKEVSTFVIDFLTKNALWTVLMTHSLPLSLRLKLLKRRGTLGLKVFAT